MVNLNKIKQARENISKIINETPLMTSESISSEVGNQIFFKCEHLQKTGSFKIRGASNKIINEASKGARSIVAASSGNHGQAVSYIARKLGLTPTIVVPANVAACKQKGIRAYHGNIEFCGESSEERLGRAKQISKEENAPYVPPYDDPLIMAGQGTIGLEILEQLDSVDEVYVPIGGGGLISGVATAIKEIKPHVRIIGVEPKLANDTYLSILKGERVNIGGSTTIADGLRTATPGELTFPIIQKYVDEIVLVDEEEIKTAFTIVLTRMKQVIETSAAVAVAAAMTREAEGKKIVALCSGGNVDTSVVSSILG
ncbi:threonine ammonia-lyase [Oceanobacillus damuensis]|uniref:threonine ammonia-lyase n=1 Tax=Oceanobacillus damuensis TaxID=937928 RepID=UPI00082F4070|nr:threonine/serine dehydratase [Oceanobacillus damuensis]